MKKRKPMKKRGSVFMSDLDGLDGLPELTAFEAACNRAMWPRPFVTVPAQRAAPADEARADRQAEAQARPAHQAEPEARLAHQAQPRTTRRNAPPANALEALRRLLDCNRNELAAWLGVSRQTLHRWERGQIPGPGRARVADLMRATLAAAQADWTMGPDFSPAALPPG